MNKAKKSFRSLRLAFSWEAIFILAVTCLMGCLYFLVVPFIELVELKAWDLHFRQRGAILPGGGVVFVSIDDASVNRDGRWPWPRRQMAKLLEAVDAYGAKVIGLDMGFFEPDQKLRKQALTEARERFRNDPLISPATGVISQLEALAREEDDDEILSETIRRLTAPLVLGHYFYAADSTFLPPAPPREVLDGAACPVVQTLEEPRANSLKEAGGVETNIEIVRKASRFSGSFNVYADPDGCVRWMPLVVRYQGSLFPSVALQMLAVSHPEYQLAIRLDQGGVLEARLGPISIPTNNRGELLVNYYGPGYTFPHYSASALLHKEAPEGCLKDRLVVIGNTTMGLHDMRPTPFDPVFPGVELHCVVMENILQGHFLQRSERTAAFVDMGVLVGLALIFLFVQSHLRGIPLAVTVLAMLGGYIVATHFFFLNAGMWLNHVYPTLNLGVCYLGTTVHRYVKEERDKRKIRDTFSLYVHSSVVEDVLAHPERLRLGGEKKELSVMFSDIRGFTTLSEKMPPEEIVPQLNDYLTRMTQVVFDHHGTLDKFIGDAIMAIFGAPVEQTDHAVRACATAVDMIRTLRLLQQEWREKGLPVLHIGVGINSGMMVVGNMGSERRFDYTVIGDNVNLASRLEGLTKMYGVSIIASESTWEAAKSTLAGRELDIVRVSGKRQPVAIYQVMARVEDTGTLADPLEVYAEALVMFRKGDWKRALELFEKVEQWWSGDPPSRQYQARCRELIEHPPGPDWSFVTTLDHK